MWEKDGIFQRVWNSPYGFTTPFQLFDAAKNSRKFIQKLRLQVKLPVHNGCVNSICWNDTGEYLLSGSDDQHLCITHGYKHTVLANIQTGHRANIFSAKFLPSTGDTQVISCSGDGIIIYSNLEHSESSMNNVFNCHFGTAYEIMTVPNDPHTFLSCGEDGTVRWFDLRTKSCCSTEECKEDILINCRCAVTSLAVNPLTPYQLAVGCADSSVRIFDRRMLGTRATGNYMGSGIQAMMAHFTVPEFDGHNHRITSLSYSPDGQEMLVSYSSDYIYLFDVKDDFNKDPRVLGSESPDKECGKSGKGKSSSRPLMKRLRVRGDWSDTGPNARPESESRGEQQPRSLHASLMQRMSDVLTRMFNSPSRTRQQSAASHSSSTSSHISSHSGSEGEASDEEEREESLVGNTTEPQTNESTVENKANKEENSSSNNHCEAGVDLTKESTENSETKMETGIEQQITLSEKCNESDSFSVIKPSDISSATNSKCSSSDTPANHPEFESMDVDHDDDEDDKPGSEVLNLSLQDLEQELSSRRKDLIEKHRVEPMVNLHFSGQGVNSGLITMDVASTSRSSEQQWLEQSSADCHSEPNEDTLLAANSHKAESTTSLNIQLESSCDNKQSAVSNTENDKVLNNNTDACDTALNLVTSNENERNLNNNETLEPCSSSKQTEVCLPEIVVEGTSSTSLTQSTDQRESVSQRNELQPERFDRNRLQDEGEPALLMEMDTWDVDTSSDDEQTRHQSDDQPSQRRTSSESVPESILRSIDEELKFRREELRKEKIQMMSVPQPRVKRKFTGHRNARTMIKEATFWGNNFIMSGSDCGHIFIWDRFTTELVMLMEADHHVVNCLQPHPFDPVLASSGIDYDIKLWSPLRDEPFFDIDKAREIVKRNEVMLEETKDTITVPASFMIRMLASLNHLRSSGGSGWRRAARENRNEEPDTSNH